MLPWLMILAQGPAPPTVGDTVWITRTVAVPAAVTVRPRPVPTSGLVEALGAPEIVLVGGRVRLRYPLVVWEPGTHQVTVPGPILVRTDGWSDTLPDWKETIVVASVLPEGASPDSLEPRPAVEIVPQSRRSSAPALGLLALALLLLWPLHRRWRRRGTSVAGPPAAPRGAPEPAQLMAWAEAGEYRAAIAGWHRRLARAGADDDRVSALRERLSDARFSPADPKVMEALCAEAADWAREVRR
jgi:hypothetical protein